MARPRTQPRVTSKPTPTTEVSPIRARSTLAPRARVKQSAKDVERGVRDTSRAEEADATYRRLKR